MSGKSKLFIITNMYPSKTHPQYGSFILAIRKIFDKTNFEVKLISLDFTNSGFYKFLKYLIFNLKICHALFFNYRSVFYFHYPTHTTLPLLFFKKGKRKIIINFHGSDFFLKGILSEILKKNIHKTNKIIVPSKFFEPLVKKKYSYKNEIITIPTAGVPKSFFFNGRIRNKLVIKSNKPISLGFVGRITEKKGFDIVIEVFKYLKKNQMNYNLIVIGQKQEINWKSRFNNDPFLNQITWVGEVERNLLCKYYSEIDFLLFPSRYRESLGLVVLEAMACDCIVLMSEQESLNGILTGKESVKQLPLKAKSFCEEIIKISQLKTEILIEEILQSRKTAQEFSEEIISKKYLKEIN